MSYIEIFILMVFAHFIADWALQTRLVAENKLKYLYIMFVHCFTWAVAIYIPLLIVGYHIDLAAFFFTIFIHGIVDYWKCYIIWKKYDSDSKAKEWNADNFKIWHLYADQGIHLLQVFFLWSYCLST